MTKTAIAEMKMTTRNMVLRVLAEPEAHGLIPVVQGSLLPGVAYQALAEAARKALQNPEASYNGAASGLRDILATEALHEPLAVLVLRELRRLNAHLDRITKEEG